MSQDASRPPSRLDDETIQRDKLVMLGQLTARIAHDLNNPIGYVGSNLGSLDRYLRRLQELVAAAEDYIRRGDAAGWREALTGAKWDFIRRDIPDLMRETRDGAEHLKRVVGDLKYLSRGGGAVEEVSFDDCLRGAANVMSYHFRHGVQLEMRLDAPRPLPLVKGQIIQAATNLLHNAVQACGPRGGRVLLESVQTDDGAAAAVEDDGPGVPEPEREHVFAPYHTTKDPGVGTGLGLAIVRHIAAAHDGEAICEEPRRLGGARFRFAVRGKPEGR